MDNGQLKYTEEELVDLGWNAIEGKLPGKKRRPILFWLASSAAILGVLLISFYLIDHNSKLSDSKTADIEEDASQLNAKDQILVKELGDQNGVVKSKTIQDSRTANPSNKKKKSILPKNFIKGVDSSKSVLYSVELENKNLINLSSQNQKQPLLTKSLSQKRNDFDEEIYYEKQQSVSEHIDVEFRNGLKLKAKDSTAKDNTSTKSDTLIIDNNVASVNEAKQIAAIADTRKAFSPNRQKLSPFIGGELLTNQFLNIGGQMRVGAQYSFADNKAISAEIQFGLMKENLENFTEFTNLNTSSAFYNSDSNKNYNYNAVVIELPISYNHKISDKIELKGGVVTNYTSFKASDNSSDTNFIVSIDSNFDNPNDTTDIDRYYSITDDFVEQFDQLSIGGQLGLTYEINKKISLDFNSGFAFQPLSSKDFMEYNPTLIQLGAKYEIFNKKENE